MAELEMRINRLEKEVADLKRQLEERPTPEELKDVVNFVRNIRKRTAADVALHSRK